MTRSVVRRGVARVEGCGGAALLAPCSDEPGNVGLTLLDPAVLERAARAALAGRWQIAVHAIGDRANRLVLDAFDRAGCRSQGAAGKSAHRFRIEHA